ncbi:MAG: DUF2232 domain-containing protein [Gemmatimonadales bacterium]
MAHAAGWPQGRLGRLVLAAAGFAFVAPAGLVALPVAALGLRRGTTGGWRTLWAGAFTGLAVVWLAWPGDLPGQTMRAAALLATVVFVLLADHTRWSVTHRALVSALIALAGTALLYVVLGWSWTRLHWWVEHRTGFALRIAMSGFQWDVLAGETQARFSGTLDQIVRWTANLFPAIGVLQVMVGLGLATALHGRLAVTPRGVAPAPTRDFRFSEHLGWMLVLGLVGVLFLPPVPALRLVAWNLLAVGTALFLARGWAVAAFLWVRAGAGRWVAALAALAIVFLSPVVLGVLLALGVLDAGLDLRRRATPPSTE